MAIAPTVRLEPHLARHWAADVAACRTSLRHNSRTFHTASLLLPRRVREPATVLYGFCRLADDAVDEPLAPRDAVDRLRERLDRVYAGTPITVPSDRALAAVVAMYGVPRALPDFLIDGLAWDVEGRQYDTLAELQAYAARVAGAVGAMMSLLMETRAPQALARACDLGVAMQLSNIARDVGEDAGNGRLYLPRDWLREAGIDPAAWLAKPQPDPRVDAVVLRLLAEADRLYAQASAGVGCLPLDCRPGINAARLLYAGIGHAVRRAGGDGVRHRARVPGWRKAALMVRAGLQLWPSDVALQAPSLPANQPLLDAVAASAMPQRPGRAEFVIDLFERLARDERAARRWRGQGLVRGELE
ncbi:phytoene/squalene synthase family protein [uncultured Pseudacidovorax sp.]|uniref:phytoene/squalene synthase family protein n=1 Tax=uncultured Pseudacidovorax sp. TaxID=679313 RepID=UPI0025FA17F7|nr:phytoene/squalene synthase family protein [uncultured Pseudacidovorax sp.]